MTRPTAPDSVLILRAAGSLTLILGYAVFRVPEFGVAPLELAVTWIATLFLLWLFERAASELYLRQHIDRAPVWPDEIELAIAEARHAALASYVDRGAITEQLYTHDILCEPTPPRGFMRPNPEPPVTQLFDGEKWVEIGYVGRAVAAVDNDTAAALLGRDRTGQLFGQL